jgi:hypothetical protein
MARQTAHSSELVVECYHCDNTGSGYNDGENFEKIRYETLAPDTKCLECGRTF